MTTYPCPRCGAPADLAAGCPSCGRGPDPDAAEVIRLDAEIGPMTARVAEARRSLGDMEARLRDLWWRRNAAAARVAASRGSSPSAPPFPAAASTAAPSSTAPAAGRLSSAPPFPRPLSVVPPAASARRRPEASTRLVQNALFLLGGLLLGIAAIVFTAVAWSQFGVGGRALVLAGVTVAALAVPPLVSRRGLTGTAETFAAVGLLLVVLDGYAAWYVDLFGVADHSPYVYAGAVGAVTAGFSAGYARLTGLTAPRFAALIAAQPVLPLLAEPLHPGVAGWSFLLSAVGVLDLAIARGRVRAPLGAAAYIFGGFAVLAAFLLGLGRLSVGDRLVLASAGGAALVTAAAVAVAGAVLAHSVIAQAITGGVLVAAIGVTGARCADLAGGYAGRVLIAGVVLVVAVAVVVLADRAVRLPATVRRGTWIGALIVVAVPALLAAMDAIAAAARTVRAARPVFHASLTVPAGDWRLAASLVLLTAAAFVLVRHASAIVTGAALVAFATPAALGVPWWSAPAIDLAIGVGTLVVALRVGWQWSATFAAVLGAHAIAAGLGRPGVAAATFAAVAAIGLATAWSARGRSVVGGLGLAAALLAVPALGWAGTAAFGFSPPGQARATLAAAGVAVAAALLATRRRAGYRWYAVAAALLAVVTAPGWAAAVGEPMAVYAAVALVLVVAVVPAWRNAPDAVAGRVASAVTGAVLALALLGAATGSLGTVLLRPLGWWSRVWAGTPAGTGLDPHGVGRVLGSDVVAVVLLSVACGMAAGLLRGGRGTATPAGRGSTFLGFRAAARAGAPAFAVAVPMALAAAGAPWPVVPSASLLVGLLALVAVAMRGPTRSAGIVAVLVAAFLALAGLSGSLPTWWATLRALGAILVAGAVAGASARDLPARLAGWIAAAAAVPAVAYTSARAYQVGPPGVAFAVLGAAALVLAGGTVLRGRPLPIHAAGRHVPARPAVAEARAVEAAGHAGAVLALLLTAAYARPAAAVCTFWGVALGLRALWPGVRAGVRRLLIVAAADAEVGGWWLLMAAEQVSTLEAYTLPAAALALLAGRLALRSRPGLTSWTAYGPALAAALLPTLASVLVGEGQPVRRLLLGLGALAVVVAGARERLQALVLGGGLVLIAVAVHEVTLVWDLLPRWIPLAASGLLLVGLAMTLERRRRDLARLRSALTRMS